MKTRLIAVFALMFILAAGNAMADMEEPCTWSVGVAAGGLFPISVGGGALEGGGGYYDSTNFDNTVGYSGNVMYRFPGGFTARVEVQHQELALNLDNVGKLGTLNTTPVMVLVGYQGMPSDENGIYVERGFTGHGELGGGIAFNSFDKGAGLDAMDAFNGWASDVEVKNGYVFEFGLGGDYFFSKHLSTSLDVRYLVSMAETNGWNPLFADGVNKVAADTGQVMLGMRYWFQ